MQSINFGNNIESAQRQARQNVQASSLMSKPESPISQQSAKNEHNPDTIEAKKPQLGVQAYLPKNLVKNHIEFKPAKTMAEARQFAKDNLGINDYRLKNLDCANYINEALTENYNSSPDKSVLITSCGPSFRYPAAITGEHLEFNENILSVLTEAKQRYEGSNTFQTLANEDLKNICDLTESQKKYLNYFQNGIYAELSLKEKIGYCMFLREFGRDEIPPTYSGKLSLPDGGDFWIINHEIGHARHKKNIGIPAYKKMRDSFFISQNSPDSLEKKFREIEPDWEATNKVSNYATKSPVEFVAEVYACLSNGCKFDDDVMSLYEKYGGPQVI